MEIILDHGKKQGNSVRWKPRTDCHCHKNNSHRSHAYSWSGSVAWWKQLPILSVLYKSLVLQHYSRHFQSRQGGLLHLHSNWSAYAKIPQPNTLLSGALLLRLRLIMSQVQQVRSHSKEETVGERQPRQAKRQGPAGPQYKTSKGRGSGIDLYRTSEHSAPLCKCS